MLEHKHTVHYGDKIKCPYCDHEYQDSWEIGDSKEGDFEYECEACDKPILIRRIISVEYLTEERNA